MENMVAVEERRMTAALVMVLYHMFDLIDPESESAMEVFEIGPRYSMWVCPG